MYTGVKISWCRTHVMSIKNHVSVWMQSQLLVKGVFYFSLTKFCVYRVMSTTVDNLTSVDVRFWRQIFKNIGSKYWQRNRRKSCDPGWSFLIWLWVNSKDWSLRIDSGKFNELKPSPNIHFVILGQRSSNVRFGVDHLLIQLHHRTHHWPHDLPASWIIHDFRLLVRDPGLWPDMTSPASQAHLFTSLRHLADYSTSPPPPPRVSSTPILESPAAQPSRDHLIT